MRRVLFYITICSISISCSINDPEQYQISSDGAVTLRYDNNPDYSPHKISEAIMGDYTVYEKYFTGTDYEIGLSSHKDGAISGGRIISCISGISEIQPIKTKAVDFSLPKLKSFANGIEISEANISSVKTKGRGSLSDMFGTNVTFTFSNSTETKSSEPQAGSADLYIPAEIMFLAPCANSEEDINPLCYYKNFQIKWNKDENNKNGVLVAVEWNGNMVLGDDIENTSVHRTMTFCDTGEAKLPAKLFDGIPDTAICNLIILRGNCNNVVYDNYTYKLVGETHQLISFILIRNIEDNVADN